MNPLRHVSWNWFWGTLLVLMIALAAYMYATRPPLRPTEPVDTTRDDGRE